MSKIQWDADGKHFYETGVSKGVLYVKNASTGLYGKGVAWNGLTAVTESPEGAEETAVYADNIKYLSLRSAEEFKATIEAYTYPDEFEVCDGSADVAAGVKVGQQSRSTFAFCYTTKIGNENNSELGEKIHIIYGASAAPSERAYATVNDSPEAITFSWEISTVPVSVEGLKNTAHLEIDSTKCSPAALAEIKAALYGTELQEPRLLMPDEIIEICNGATTKLAAPVLSASASALTITVAADSEAESFDVYEGSVFLANVEKDTTATEVSFVTLGLSAAGDHYLKAKAQAAGVLDSDFSNEIKVTISE